MLEDASNIKLKSSNSLFPRRYGIKANKIHLFGAPKSGKTSIALNYARNFLNPFYIDFADFRNTSELISNMLLKISMEKKVDLLILDNIPLESFSMPNIANIISISEYENKIYNFANKNILPLSFEEYVSFDNSKVNINQLLSNFIKDGNLPLASKDLLEQKQDILRMLFGGHIELFKIVANFCAKRVSVNQIYTIAKKHSKTSKDFVYGFVNDLCNRGILYLIPHILSHKLPKKVFLWDFSINNVLWYQKDIISLFENMVFLELQKLNQPIFYSDKINLICGNYGFIIALFKDKEMIAKSLSGIDTLGLDIIVITLDLNAEISLNEKKILIKSFIDFALDE